jgi:NAD(P)-dependent dehydrogenase (short-subunit alcohol dehydrogenase family)
MAQRGPDSQRHVEKRPQIMTEPRPPFPKQKLEGTGEEASMRARPRFEAPLYKPAGKLEGKVAMVTGGDSGIGRAVAVIYAREGADVAVLYYSHDRDAEETRRAVGAEGRKCITIKGDIGDAAFCRDSVERVVRELGAIDILVHNAAFQQHCDKIENLPDDQFERTFRTNVYGYFYLAKASVAHMKPGSAIIATGSETGIYGSASLLDYSATKGAIHTLSQSLASALLDRGIRVNVVAPGPVWTPLNVADKGESPEKLEEFGRGSEIGRPAQPEEIAPAFVFLASDADASYITGQVIAALGGAH